MKEAKSKATELVNKFYLKDWTMPTCKYFAAAVVEEIKTALMNFGYSNTFYDDF